MTKKDYLNELSERLKDLPVDERGEILGDYSEHFRMGIEKGLTEEEISANLGSPETIAAQFLDDLEKKHPAPKKSERTKRMVAVGLVIFNIVIALWPFMGAVGFLLGLFIFSIVLAVGGGAAIIVAALSKLIAFGFTLPFSVINTIFIGIAGIILGVLLFVASIFLTRLFFKGIKAYVKYMQKIIND
jgi:uncharacterized membrane protein